MEWAVAVAASPQVQQLVSRVLRAAVGVAATAATGSFQAADQHIKAATATGEVCISWQAAAAILFGVVACILGCACTACCCGCAAGCTAHRVWIRLHTGEVASPTPQRMPSNYVHKKPEQVQAQTYIDMHNTATFLQLGGSSAIEQAASENSVTPAEVQQWLQAWKRTVAGFPGRGFRTSSD